MRGVTDGILLGIPAIDAYRLTEIGKFVGFPIGSVLGVGQLHQSGCMEQVDAGAKGDPSADSNRVGGEGPAALVR